MEILIRTIALVYSWLDTSTLEPPYSHQNVIDAAHDVDMILTAFNYPTYLWRD